MTKKSTGKSKVTPAVHAELPNGGRTRKVSVPKLSQNVPLERLIK